MTQEEIEAVRVRRVVQTERSDGDHPFKNADSRRANLSGMDWSGEVFSGCDLRGANLSRCNFAGADFRESILWDADLSDSDLTGAVNLMPAQLAATNLRGARLAEPLDSFEALESVDGLSENSAKVFLTIIGAVVYAFLTIATTTDLQLITNTNPIKLPVIGTEIPPLGFYVVTPVILLALFIYFHIYLQRLWEAMAQLPAIFPNGRRLDEKTFTWLMNDMVRQYFPRLRRPAIPLSRLQTLLSILLGYWLVPFALACLWAEFLRVQSWWITGIHIAIFTVTVGCATYFSYLLRKTLDGSGLRVMPVAPRNRWVGILRCVPAALALFFTTCCSFLVFESGKEDEEEVLPLFAALGVRTTALIDNADISAKPPSWTGADDKRDAELALCKPVSFSSKSFRRIHAVSAFFAKSTFKDVDFTLGRLIYADFRQANFSFTKAERAIFIGCKFADKMPAPSSAPAKDDFKKADAASFSGCNFAGADFLSAILSFVSATNSNFAGAIFSSADCIGVRFYNCTLEGARFSSALCNYAYFGNPCGSNMPIAKLNGANFSMSNCSGARFEKCDLSQADFSNAILDRAEFDCSDLAGANLADASLQGTKFDSANLTGANFVNASLQGADLSNAKGLTEAQLRGARTLYQAILPWFLTVALKEKVSTPPSP